jgi:hypothetical protein
MMKSTRIGKPQKREYVLVIAEHQVNLDPRLPELDPLGWRRRIDKALNGLLQEPSGMRRAG